MENKLEINKLDHMKKIELLPNANVMFSKTETNCKLNEVIKTVNTLIDLKSVKPILICYIPYLHFDSAEKCKEVLIETREKLSHLESDYKIIVTQSVTNTDIEFEVINCDDSELVDFSEVQEKIYKLME